MMVIARDTAQVGSFVSGKIPSITGDILEVEQLDASHRYHAYFFRQVGVWGHLGAPKTRMEILPEIESRPGYTLIVVDAGHIKQGGLS